MRATSSPTAHRSPTILKFVMNYKHPRENETSLPTTLLPTTRSEELMVERSDARNTTTALLLSTHLSYTILNFVTSVYHKKWVGERFINI